MRLAGSGGSADPSDNANLALLYIGIIVPLIIFAFAALSYLDIYTGPGSDIEAATWRNVIIFVVVLFILVNVGVLVASRPKEGPSPPQRSPPTSQAVPARRAAGGSPARERVVFTMSSDKDGGGEGRGKSSSQRPEPAAPEVKAAEKGTQKPAAPAGEELDKDDVQGMMGGATCSPGMSLVNKRILEFPPPGEDGIFCETFVSVDDGTVLKYRQKVASDVYVEA
jgi:hypothetical protein